MLFVWPEQTIVWSEQTIVWRQQTIVWPEQTIISLGLTTRKNTETQKKSWRENRKTTIRLHTAANNQKKYRPRYGGGIMKLKKKELFDAQFGICSNISLQFVARLHLCLAATNETSGPNKDKQDYGKGRTILPINM